MELMEAAVQFRALSRSAFIRNANALKELLEMEHTDSDEISVSLELLQERATESVGLDSKILMSMINTKTGDSENESQEAEEYQRSFRQLRLRALNRVSALKKVLSIPTQRLEGEVEINCIPPSSQRKFKLPKLELRKFNGDLKEWLHFWSQFGKIDADPDIAPEDKFQYLLQATVPGSRDREVVESFPPTAQNYSKAISCLKSRFGKDELFVEVYVRELLSLVLDNALYSGPQKSLAVPYDKLESHLRNLESLGVTTEKCNAMLFPLVESCLPEDILRAWQRSGSVDLHNAGDRSNKKTESRLERLMSFLGSEVENQEKINLAMSGFRLKDKHVQGKKTPSSAAGKSVPTASGLLSADVSKANVCVFCDGNHNSADCLAAQKMDLEEEQKRLRTKGCCFSCLKVGHLRKRCKVRPGSNAAPKVPDASANARVSRRQPMNFLVYEYMQ